MNMTHTTLGELLDVRRGMSIASEDCATEGTYKRLTCGNFDYNNHCFTEDNGKENVFFVGKIREDCLLKKGAIITPLTEQAKGLLGETARIPEDGVYIQSGDIGLVIPYEDKLDDLFAYYLVSSPVVKKQLGAGAQQTKIRHTSPDAIKACEVWVPEDIRVQHQIGEILDKINSKIALNNSICADLEAMAKQIYDYWFVQFDFPDENGRPYKSSGGAMEWNDELKREIPVGWSCKTINDIASRVKVGFVGTVDKYYCETEEGFPIVRPAELSKNGIDYSSLRHITEEFYHKNKKSQVRKGNILISRCGKDGIPNIYDFEEEAQVLNAVIIEQDESKENEIFICESLKSDFCQKQIAFGTSGSVQGVINTEMIALLKIAYNERLCEEYIEKCKRMYQNITQVRAQNRELAELRDFLLPMLMNGQIKVGA